MIKNTFGGLLNVLETHYINYMTDATFWGNRCIEEPDKLLYCEIRNRAAEQANTIYHVLETVLEPEEIQRLRFIAYDKAAEL
jgi:hypothetical protein